MSVNNLSRCMRPPLLTAEKFARLDKDYRVEIVSCLGYYEINWLEHDANSDHAKRAIKKALEEFKRRKNEAFDRRLKLCAKLGLNPYWF